MIGDRPVLFDCLEFDEALATIDVFYDLAFLLMDLCHRGLDDLAVDLLNAYLDRTEDDEATALLPLFLAIRTTIRAKIEGFEIRTAGSADDISKHRLAVVQYIDLARDLLATAPPKLIAIGGLSGTGKSTVARLLAHRLGRKHWPLVLRSDVIRKRLQSMQPTARLGAEAYSPSRSADVYRHLRDRAATLLRVGRTVIADATFLNQMERSRIESWPPISLSPSTASGSMHRQLSSNNVWPDAGMTPPTPILMFSKGNSNATSDRCLGW